MSEKVELFFEERIQQAKMQFERTIDCKHTQFDDLYPYMSEQPQFFWYKRYVGWQELLTTVHLAEDFGVGWDSQFTKKQAEYISQKVLDAKVLDNWYPQDSQKLSEEQEHKQN